MKTKYIDLIDQTFYYPTEEFKTIEGELHFNDVPLMEILKQYGTPVKITYVPKINSQIQKAKRLFNVAMAKIDYTGKYYYCYCTKSSHFSFIIEEALKDDVHLEISSAFDINIIRELVESGLFNKDGYVICNGFKRDQYMQNIIDLVHDGFENVIPILDNRREFDLYDNLLKKKCKAGIRIATEEEPKFHFYTSRLGIRYNDIIPFYEEKIKNSKKMELKM